MYKAFPLSESIKRAGKYFIIILIAISGISSLTSCGNKNKTEVVKHANENISPIIAELTAKINANPGSATLYKERALAFLKMNLTEEALLDINKALNIDSTKVDYLILRSDVYFAMGKAGKCRESLQKAIKLDDKNEEALLKMAELHFYFKEYDKTFEFIDKALAINKLNSKAWFMRGMTYKDMGDTIKAIRALTGAIERNQNHYEAYLYLGIIHTGLKSPLAEDYYRNALNIKPDSPEVLYNLGLFYQETGEYDKAIQTYTMVTSRTINENNPEFLFLKHSYYNLGYIQLQYTQLYKQSVKYFTSAISLDPLFVEAFYNRGYAYELMGDAGNARLDYNKALELKTNYELALQGLNRLDASARVK